MSGIGFEGGQLALLLMQAPFERGPDVLELSIGQPGQGQEFVGEVLSSAQGGEDTFDIGGGGEHLTCFDFGNLALGDAAPGGKTFAGEANGLAGISQSGRQLILALA
jgi:hypothetical protein